MTPDIHKAVLVLQVARGQHTGKIIVQDRRGYKPPLWGYFGGSIEAGETPLQGIQREIQEELDLTLNPEQLQVLGTCHGQLGQQSYAIHVFLHCFTGDPATLTVLEGAGLDVVAPETMLSRCDRGSPDEAITLLAMGHFAETATKNPPLQ